jgi:predicted kinase
MKRTILAVVASLAFAAPAFAHQCPAMAAVIRDTLATSTADDATKAQIQALLDEGMALHEAGDHDASVAKMEEALTLLGMGAG